VVPAFVAIFWFPMFVIWEGYDSIACVMNEDLLKSCIRSEHPHYIHDFAFVMSDDFLYSFIHSENPHNIHTISSVYSLDIEKVILYQSMYKILQYCISNKYSVRNFGHYALLQSSIDIFWISGKGLWAFSMSPLYVE
jgi:hypothetical protein